MESSAVLILVAEILSEVPISAERMPLTHSGNTIYEVTLPERTVIVRIREDEADTFSGTAGNIAALRQLGLPVPQVLAADITRTRFPFAYMILEKIPGRDLLYELASMPSEQMTRLAEEIVDIQRRVGTLPMGTGFGWGNVGGGGNEAVWLDVVHNESSPTSLAKQPFAELRLAHYRKRLQLQSYFRRLSPVCFLEDLTTKNIILNKGKLQGIIDFDSVCFGDPLWQVGIAAGCILNDVGEQELFYVEELCRIWEVMDEQREVIAYYSAQRALEFLDIALGNHETDLVQRLAVTIEQWVSL